MTSTPSNVVVLDSDDDNREPTEEEVIEYAEFLGLDPSTEAHLMWIAREGVVAPIQHPWKACTENGDNIFYFNFETGESVWDHPCDEKYRQLLEDERNKKTSSPRQSPRTGKQTETSNDAGAGKSEELDSEKRAPSTSTSKHEETKLEDAPCSITPTPARSQLKEDVNDSGDETPQPARKHSVPIVLLTDTTKEPEEDQTSKDGDVYSSPDSRKSSPRGVIGSSSPRQNAGKLTVPPLNPRAMSSSPYASPRLEKGQLSPGGSRSGTKESSSGRSDGGRSEGLSSELSEEFDLGPGPSEMALFSRRGSAVNRRDSLAYSMCSEMDTTPLGESRDSFISFHFESETRRGSQIEAIPEIVDETASGAGSAPRRIKNVESELAALARTLSKLREIRGQQVEYLQILRNGAK